MIRSRLAPTAVLAVALVCTPASADRLHLAGGGEIDVGSWWVEDDTLVYEGPAGTVGIPRSMVERIESTAGGRVAPVEAAPSRAAAPAAAPAAPDRGVRVSAELARDLEAGRTALEQGDYETASQRFGAALAASDAELAVARIGRALSLIALDEDPLALSVVLDGLARDPRQPQLLELLGDLHNRRERVDEALQAWRDAFRLAPNDRLREKIFKAEREMHAGRDYRMTTSSHFNLRFDDAVEPQLARDVAAYLEEQFWVLAETLDHTPQRPITVLLYPKQEFRDVTQAPEWVGGLYDGKIRVPLGGLRRLDPMAEALLVHELTHAVVHAKTRGHAPRWLHEGLAQQMEGRALSPADRNAVARTVAAGDAALWEQHGFSYPVALSLTRYLESLRGRPALVDLLERIGEGGPTDAALRAIYGMDYALLCRRWADEFRRTRR